MRRVQILDFKQGVRAAKGEYRRVAIMRGDEDGSARGSATVVPQRANIGTLERYEFSLNRFRIPKSGGF
jgi:hypothetical protein